MCGQKHIAERPFFSCLGLLLTLGSWGALRGEEPQRNGEVGRGCKELFRCDGGRFRTSQALPSEKVEGDAGMLEDPTTWLSDLMNGCQMQKNF